MKSPIYGKEKFGITISLDYCFMNGEGDEDPDLPGVLGIWDDNRECLWAIPVDKKGPTDWVVSWIVEKLDNIGYQGESITLKSDQEPAIMSLKNAVVAKRAGVTTPTKSTVRQSQCNGAVEQAVRRWQWQLRTMKHHYETSINKKLPVTNSHGMARHLGR